MDSVISTALRTHTEVRQVPLYALTVEEPGKLGPYLKSSPYNCRAFMARGGKVNDPDAPPRDVCWTTSLEPRMRDGVPLHRDAGTMNDLILDVVVNGISAERPVIDATGLTGNFEWEIAFTPDQPTSIFVALEDQLGLKLERRTGLWEVIVIDSVQMPTAN